MRHALAAAAILCLVATSGLQGQDGPYHAGKEIAIGGEGGWDYLSIDPAAHRLYVSHATHVVVIDTQANKVVGDIPDTPGVHGFAIAADLGRGFSSNGRENKASIVDLKTLKLIQKVDTGQNPDAILYEPARHEVYTMNGRGKSATVIDAQSGKVVATIPLEGKPESAQADSKAGRVYVNIEDMNAVHRLRQQADADDRQHERQGGLQRAGRRRRRLHLVRSRHQAGVHVERRIGHRHRRARGVADRAESGADSEDPRRRAHDGSRSVDAHDLPGGDDYEPQPAAAKGRPKAVVGTFRVLTYQMK